MSMYVTYLSDALGAWNCDDLTQDELVDHAVRSCAQLLAIRLGSTRSAYELLAAEVAYDRALIRLCDEVSVTTSATNFADPTAERFRIERVLAESRNIDLNGLARARRLG